MFRTYQNALWQTQKLPNGTEKKAIVAKKRGRTPVIMTEEQVLESRARFEYFGWSISHLANYYGLRPQYVRNLMDYQTRGELIPERRHANLEAA